MSSYSIPFHLTALFPLSVHHQHTDQDNSSLTTTTNHSLTPSSVSVYLHQQRKGLLQRNYLQGATPTSSANQPMAEQTGEQATGIKGAYSSQRDSGPLPEQED